MGEGREGERERGRRNRGKEPFFARQNYKTVAFWTMG